MPLPLLTHCKCRLRLRPLPRGRYDFEPQLPTALPLYRRFGLHVAREVGPLSNGHGRQEEDALVPAVTHPLRGCGDHTATPDTQRHIITSSI